MSINLSGVLSALGHAAEQLVPQLVPGAAPLLGLAHSISAAFETAKAANGGTAPAEAQASSDALLRRVQAHAESTLGRLEGR
jgi:hypothetical protein